MDSIVSICMPQDMDQIMQLSEADLEKLEDSKRVFAEVKDTMYNCMEHSHPMVESEKQPNVVR